MGKKSLMSNVEKQDPKEGKNEMLFFKGASQIYQAS
jgi:hypothetical protein